MTDDKLTQVAKEELALALLLWKDFKIKDNPDPVAVYKNMYYLARHVGVTNELEVLNNQIHWKFKITLGE